jgi:hypothetical protein
MQITTPNAIQEQVKDLEDQIDALPQVPDLAKVASLKEQAQRLLDGCVPLLDPSSKLHTTTRESIAKDVVRIRRSIQLLGNIQDAVGPASVTT